MILTQDIISSSQGLLDPFSHLLVSDLWFLVTERSVISWLPLMDNLWWWTSNEFLLPVAKTIFIFFVDCCSCTPSLSTSPGSFQMSASSFGFPCLLFRRFGLLDTIPRSTSPMSAVLFTWFSASWLARPFFFHVRAAPQNLLTDHFNCVYFCSPQSWQSP